MASPGSTVDLRLIKAAALLERDPSAAAREAAALLGEHPDNLQAALLLGAARRGCGDRLAAAQVFEKLAAAHPRSAPIQLEYAYSLAAQQRNAEALRTLRLAVELEPNLAEAWQELARVFAADGDEANCDVAYARYRKLKRPDRELEEAEVLLDNRRIDAAAAPLERRLKAAPHDVDALRLLARVAVEREDFGEAQRLLAECLRLAPGFSQARFDLVSLFSLQQKPDAMLPLLARLLRLEPASLSFRTSRATAYNLLGQNAEALATLTPLLAEFPQDVRVWLAYGHALRAGGRNRESIDAYRRCIELSPRFADAWFSLANLKTFRFSAAEVALMQQQSERTELRDDERVMFEFALGKAREDASEFEQAFLHYARGNALRRAALAYDVTDTTRFVDRNLALYTRAFFAARAAPDSPAAEPIFIVGLPRSGSTLLEQILASHSQVEGTRELPYVLGIAREYGALESMDRPRTYPQSIAALSSAQLAALGERYLEEAASHRLLGRAHFVDKLPSNWMHVGLIHLMLPKARIIDARRSPLACCVANFKQYFQQGMWFSYSLEDLGHYYREYVRLMAHFDAVLPGRVHRVHYEELVRDLEGEVRRLLDYCGLPFEEQCLRFHETQRVVQTVSSEQVRRPIYQEGLEQWRNFEPWLGPLRSALGDLA